MTQGLEMTFRGDGDWGVSTLSAYYDRGQRRAEPTSDRQPFVALFGEVGDALQYARKRAHAAKGTSYYVLLYDDTDPAIVYRVLRTHSGQKQPRGGGEILEPSREFVFVFENTGTLPDGRIRWKMSLANTVEVEDIEVRREQAALRRGTLRPPAREPGAARRSLSAEERLVTRMQSQGYNDQEIELALRDLRRKSRR